MFRVTDTAAAKQAREQGHGVYAIDWKTAEERINREKAIVTDTNQQMDPERLQALKEVYNENKGEEPIILRARLLEKLLLTKKLYLDGNPIVGTMTSIPCGLYAYPEWNCDWLKDEMDMAKISSLGTVVISEDTQNLMMDIYRDWKGRTCKDVADREFKELYGINIRPYVKSALIYDAMYNSLGSGVVDYSIILNKGARGLLEEVEGYLRGLSYQAGEQRKHAFYTAVKIVLKAFIAWAHRYADLAQSEAEKETDPARKAELLEIAQVCRVVPENPASNFREAVQSFWFTHLLVEMEQMGCANSPGRYGQYMYSFYKKDMEEGRITREEAELLLRFQFVRHTELGAYSGMAHQTALSGHTGQTISLGGVTADGRDASNDLEELLMDVQTKMKNIQPTLALFYTPMMEDEYLMKAVEVVRTGTGQPQFMNNAVAV